MIRFKVTLVVSVVLWLLLVLLLPVGVRGQVTQIDTLYDNDTNTGKALYFDDSSYLTARSSASCEALVTDFERVGQWYGDPNSAVMRSYIGFDLSGIPAGSTVDSATLDMYGTANNSTIDFDWGIYDSGQPGTIVLSDFSSFPGWQTGSQTYTPTAWGTTKRNSSTWTSGYGNTFTLNTAGKSAIQSNIGGNFQIILLSDEDINYSSPSDAEYIRFTGSQAGSNNNRLIVNYTLPSPAPIGDTKTRALGTILYRGRGQELAADRNKGKVINATKKKKG